MGSTLRDDGPDEALGLGADLDLRAVLVRLLAAARRASGGATAAVGALAADGAGMQVLVDAGDGPEPRIDLPPLPPGALNLPLRGGAHVVGRLQVAAPDEAARQHLEHLAGAAGPAVENARRHEQAARRLRFLEALAEVQEVLLTAPGRDAVLQLVADRAREVVDAALAAVLLPDEDGLVVEVASLRDGTGAGGPYDAAGSSAAEVLRTGRAALLADTGAEEPALGPVTGAPAGGPGLLLPLPSAAGEGVWGVLAVVLDAGADAASAFPRGAVQQLTTLAGQATLALDRVRAREDRARLAVYEDRERIARDLHDHVIQQVFATGLQVQGVARGLDAEPRARLEEAVDELDAAIASIRGMIHQLGQPDGALAAEVRGLVDRSERLLGWRPALEVRGPLDEGVPARVRPHLVAVLREALSNVARHAGASAAWVRVDVGDRIVAEVRDDGVGPGTSGRRSGLRNLRERAEGLGGSMLVEAVEGGGTRVRWDVPLRG
ncbi:GAF domain-containing sensor histidine kinase [Vallicoccus soli]|uniref:GAF domain-containing protein n=1 Tax=Vallicoccus soli TaxID=2339232 RepID=A0A3A3ZCU1_9ACTN|nr:GAF domain-containing protein [Vallicoccus soli]RJK92794.1 GAF domain-containing protein [Vallicoccus soli]